MKPFATRLRDEPVVVLDGGLATCLEQRGHRLDDELWSARLLLDDPGAIEEMHRAYVEAGAEVLITATYQASVEGFGRRGLGRAKASALFAESVALARRAAGARPVYVAGSVGTIGATFADGAEYRGRYALSRARYRDFHAPRMDALVAAGVDVLALETLPDLDEARALVELAEELETPAWLAFTCGDDATLRGGAPFDEACALAAASPVVVAAGVNCTAPRHVARLLARAQHAGVPLLCYPNSGEGWDARARRWTPADRADDLVALAPAWVARGARAIGGCCRTGPDDIAALARALRGRGETTRPLTGRSPPRS